MAMSIRRSGKGKLFYTRKVSHFLQFLLKPPQIIDENGESRLPSELKSLSFDTEESVKIAICVYNSSLFYWFFISQSDCRNVNKREVYNFPISFEKLSQSENGKKLANLGKCLSDHLITSSVMNYMKFKGQTLKIQCFYPKMSKAIIDEIDETIGEFLKLTPQEIDYIKSYDVKFRLGASADDGS